MKKFYTVEITDKFEDLDELWEESGRSLKKMIELINIKEYNPCRDYTYQIFNHIIARYKNNSEDNVRLDGVLHIPIYLVGEGDKD